MIPDGQLLCCASDLLAGQIDARQMHFFGQGEFCGWTLASDRCSAIALKQLYRSPLWSHRRMPTSFFFHVGQQGPGPTSDYCKELLTLTLTPFFLMLFHVTCPFFLTPVAKYSHGFEKYSLVLR